MDTSLFNTKALKGKVALITGGSNGGMLSEIAKIYLEHGAKAVVLIARKKEKLDKVVESLQPFAQEGCECLGMTGDVRDEESITKIIIQVLEKHSSIDILVNGAAGNFLCPAEKLSVKGFKTVLDIDATGTFMVSKLVFEHAMKKQKSGSIINITTNLHYNGTPMTIHANSAKAAVDAIMRTLAVEWGPYGVRVTGICPGFISGTEGMARLGDLDSVGDKEKSKKSIEKGDSMAESAEIVPLGRLGEGRDIANAALFLGSDMSSYVTGSVLMVDGGSNLTCPNFIMHSPAFVKMWSAPRRAKM
jgi:2,4-dienoyl-CoA reductase [(3E)-enoyl-CoA-producing], peroxisomal